MREMIAACGFETWAPAIGPFSFMWSLIDESVRWNSSHYADISVAALQSKILSRIKGSRRFERWTKHEERKTSIYVQLSNEGSRNRITLRPLEPRYTVPSELVGDPMQEDTSTSSTTPAEIDSSPESAVSQSSQSSRDHFLPGREFSGPTVVLSLQLEEDQWMQTDKWIEWLRSVPVMTKFTRVQGI